MIFDRLEYFRDIYIILPSLFIADSHFFKGGGLDRCFLIHHIGLRSTLAVKANFVQLCSPDAILTLLPLLFREITRFPHDPGMEKVKERRRPICHGRTGTVTPPCLLRFGQNKKMEKIILWKPAAAELFCLPLPPPFQRRWLARPCWPWDWEKPSKPMRRPIQRPRMRRLFPASESGSYQGVPPSYTLPLVFILTLVSNPGKAPPPCLSNLHPLTLCMIESRYAFTFIQSNPT